MIPGLRLSVAGFLLLDSSLKPIYFNDEAIHILAYPEKLSTEKPMGTLLANTLGPELLNFQSSQTPFLTEFMSGKRCYLCYAFSLNTHSRDSSDSTSALIMLRSLTESAVISQMAVQFNLTKREQSVVVQLMKGYSSKEIADRMKISPNTVNSFFRFIMVKMGVSSRAGIIGRMFKTMLLRSPDLSGLSPHDPTQPAPRLEDSHLVKSSLS